VRYLFLCLLRVLSRRGSFKMMRFRSDLPCYHPSFQSRQARFSPSLLSQHRQTTSAPSIVTFLTRSLMYRQRSRNGQRHIYSLCHQRLLQLSRTLGTLLLLKSLPTRTVLVTSWAGYDRDTNHESRNLSLGRVPAFVILFTFDLCFSVG
jgi:hypothetical protein